MIVNNNRRDAMMKQAKAIGGAGIDAVTLNEVAIPEAGAGEALVRLHAATLNFRDLIIVRGMMKGLTKEPDVVPFSCGAGEVVSVGAGVTRVKAGDRVTPIFTQGWFAGPQTSMNMLGGSVDGTARQYGVFDAESLCMIPDMLGDLEAATLPCAGLTAWSALTQHRSVAPGEWVLCHGTGGVSIAALQFAKAMGGKVVITSSSDAKLARAQSMGADVTINYRTNPDWEAAVRAAVGGNMIAVVVDVVGADQFEKNASLLKEGGLVAAIGMLGSDFSWGKEGTGFNVGRITVGNRSQHEAMVAFIEHHSIRPVVDAVYDLDRIKDAYRRLESGQFFGKVGISLQ